MHDQAHELFMILGINLVIASPFFALWLDRRGFFGERELMVTVSRGLVIPLAALAIGAAAIHLALLLTRVAESGALGLVDGSGALFGILWAIAWLRRPTRSVALIGIAGGAAFIVLWVALRTGALPVGESAGAHGGAHTGAPGVLGLGDTFATMFEVTLVLGLAARLWRPLAHAAETRLLPARSASLGIAMALMAIAMMTAFGMASA